MDALTLVAEERRVFAGIDVGQVNDWTALAIVERVLFVPRRGICMSQLPQAKAEAKAKGTQLYMRALDRIPLGTPYPQQVEIVQQKLRNPRLGDVRSFLDMTGCGRPVFDMFKQAQLPNLSGVMITGAHGEATRQPYGWNVGKAELVNRLIVEMQTGRLVGAAKAEFQAALDRELKEFKAKLAPSGHMTFNAREGQHDDLVLALAIAVFGALRPAPVHSLDVRFATA